MREAVSHSQRISITPGYLITENTFEDLKFFFCRSQWPWGLRGGSAAARLLGLWVRMPPGSWMSVSCECCVVSGRGLCDGLVPRPEESYRVSCVWSVWSWSVQKWGGCRAIKVKVFFLTCLLLGRQVATEWILSKSVHRQFSVCEFVQ
jgi:hypothetical protein